VNKIPSARGRSLPRLFLFPAGFLLPILIPALLFTSASSCKPPSRTDQILIGGSGYLSLLEGEENIPIQPDDLAFYETHFNPAGSALQMPLYRLIRHGSYTLYLALPLQTSDAQWLRRLETADHSRWSRLEQEATHTLAFWSEQGRQLGHYAYHPRGKVEWVLCVAGQDSSILPALLAPAAVSDRFTSL
jgi:hypothetical protein